DSTLCFVSNNLAIRKKARNSRYISSKIKINIFVQCCIDRRRHKQIRVRGLQLLGNAASAIVRAGVIGDDRHSAAPLRDDGPGPFTANGCWLGNKTIRAANWGRRWRPSPGLNTDDYRRLATI